MVLLDKIDVNAEIMMIYRGYSEDGYLVFEAMEDWGDSFKAGDEIKYRVTSSCILSSKLKESSIVIPGQFLMKKSISVLPDETLAKIFTLTKARNTKGLGKPLHEVESWTINKGKIRYSNNKVYIGDVEYKLDDDEIYMYPEGYKIDVAQQFCSGVPDMNALKNKTDKLYGDDYGVLYAVFFYYIKTIGAFSKFNSEPFELLFKVLVNNNFKVDTAIANDEELINRLFHGASTRQMTDFITEMVHGPRDSNGTYMGGVQYRYNRKVAELINANMDDVKKSEIDAKNKDTSTPTIRKIWISKNYEGGYDWKGIFKLMNAESKDKVSYVKWSWDKVRDNLRTFIGTSKSKTDDKDINNYTLSIAQCRSRVESTPKKVLQIQELETKMEELIESLDENADENLINETNEQYNHLKERVEQLKSSNSNDEKDYWKKKLESAKAAYSKLSNAELNRQLNAWLVRGKYGSSLKPYVTSTNTYVKLKITVPNYTEDESDEILDIESQIKELRDEQMKLDDSKSKDKEKINDIEKEIRSLNSRKRKVADSTKIHGIVNKKNNWIADLILARH